MKKLYFLCFLMNTLNKIGRANLMLFYQCCFIISSCYHVISFNNYAAKVICFLNLYDLHINNICSTFARLFLN
jgi:hypothetical protein